MHGVEGDADEHAGRAGESAGNEEGLEINEIGIDAEQRRSALIDGDGADLPAETRVEQINKKAATIRSVLRTITAWIKVTRKPRKE
jgi:hypothetical protein